MKKIFLVTSVLLAAASLKAQFVYDYVKAADEYFQKGDYASAAEYYEKYFDDSKGANQNEFKPYAPQNASKKKATSATTKEQAQYRLAESYRLLNYPAKAETNYKKSMDLAKGQFPLAQYHYAAQLRALGKYAEAEQNFKDFLAGYSTNDEYRKNAERELKNLQFIQSQLAKTDIKYYTVIKAPAELNTKGASYAPAWMNESTLLFTSTRPLDTTSKNLKYTNRVYQAVYTTGGSLGAISKTELGQDPDMQQGVVSMTPDGNTMFLTRWSVASNKKDARIYSSHRNNDGWSNPEKLDDKINSDEYHTQQPFVTPDGKYLVFSSNRPGGQGGYDLWYAPLENGKPGTPQNMGATINTAYDEQAAFYHDASKSLIFSSNGRVGMGGYDFFQSKGYFGSWADPVNLGYPVNSIKDDIYFTSRGPAKNILENVVLSSDRDNACCLELYSLKKIRPLKQISGRVISCDPAKPLGTATVDIVDASNNTIYKATTKADGTYSFTVEDHQNVKVNAEATGYISNSVNVATPTDIEQEVMVYPDLCLKPEPPKVDEKFVIENVYYDFDSASLKPESFPALDEIVRMLNYYPEMVIELSAHTDSKGSDKYNMTLSEKRAESVVNYLIEKGIAPERLVAKGYGETQPIAENTVNGKDNPEGRQKNRRTEFKVLKNE